MAGNYDDVPGYRMAYDRDGSVGFTHAGSGGITVLTQAQMEEWNDEDDGAVITWGGYVGQQWLGIIFPELRDLVGYFIHHVSEYSAESYTQTSADSTNGLDGTWTTRETLTTANQYTPQPAFVNVTVPYYRTLIRPFEVAGVKAFRYLGGWNGSAGTQFVRTLHLYGSPATGQNPDRLRLWHPTLDHEVGGAYFDWADIMRNSTADRTFRVKNNSTTKTAGTITVGVEALTDTTPAVVDQYTLSNGGAFAATTSVATLAPEAISDILTLRRTTPANAALSVWAARITAEAATFA